MHIAFSASVVSYVDAIDGEIVQTYFEEKPDSATEDPLDPSNRYLLVSMSYEFPPFVPSV